MSLFSPRRKTLKQIEHIQNAVKLRVAEIDAIFLAIEESEKSGSREFVITCEAKQKKEDFNLDQIRKQPTAIFGKMPNHHLVVPIAVKAIGPSTIHVIEFAAFERDAEAETSLVMVSQAIYELEPAVPGIGT